MLCLAGPVPNFCLPFPMPSALHSRSSSCVATRRFETISACPILRFLKINQPLLLWLALHTPCMTFVFICLELLSAFRQQICLNSRYV